MNYLDLSYYFNRQNIYINSTKDNLKDFFINIIVHYLCLKKHLFLKKII